MIIMSEYWTEMEERNERIMKCSSKHEKEYNDAKAEAEATK